MYRRQQNELFNAKQPNPHCAEDALELSPLQSDQVDLREVRAS